MHLHQPPHEKQYELMFCLPLLRISSLTKYATLPYFKEVQSGKNFTNKSAGSNPDTRHKCFQALIAGSPGAKNYLLYTITDIVHHGDGALGLRAEQVLHTEYVDLKQRCELGTCNVRYIQYSPDCMYGGTIVHPSKYPGTSYLHREAKGPSQTFPTLPVPDWRPLTNPTNPTTEFD